LSSPFQPIPLLCSSGLNMLCSLPQLQLGGHDGTEGFSICLAFKIEEKKKGR
jgi:hypothetical protein